MERTFTEYEFRLNKKNAECFRTTDFHAALAKLEELQAKRPVYSMQYRERTYHTYRYKEGWEAWGFWTDLPDPSKLNPKAFQTVYPSWY